MRFINSYKVCASVTNNLVLVQRLGSAHRDAPAPEAICGLALSAGVWLMATETEISAAQ